jgi:hypothetical protein
MRAPTLTLFFFASRAAAADAGVAASLYPISQGEWVDCRRLGRRDSSTCGAGGGGDGETLKSDAASGEGREEAGG